MLWCLEDNRKRGSGNILGTSFGVSKHGMGASMGWEQPFPLIRR